MSAPDAVFDNFHHGISATNESGDANGKQISSQQPILMSPPVSPCIKPASTTSTPPVAPGRDCQRPRLVVEERSPGSQRLSLFTPDELEYHQEIVEEHVKARSKNISCCVAPPKREHCNPALTFRAQVMKCVATNRKAWLRREQALRPDSQTVAQRYHGILPVEPIATKSPWQRACVCPESKLHWTRRRLCTIAITNGTALARSDAAAEPSLRVLAPNHMDQCFYFLPDYCPPLYSLPKRANSLDVHWEGQPIDLRSDPHANLLHPDELLLASNLRLDCATYLASKRRIFERRLHFLHAGKEFRKTDAQQACKIDVSTRPQSCGLLLRMWGGWIPAGLADFSKWRSGSVSISRP